MTEPAFSARVLSLFPDWFPGPLGDSLAGRALADGTWSLEAFNLRDYATDKHQSVDDRPYGGGAGMVMRPDVLANALDAALDGFDGAQLLYMSPRGAPITQKKVKALVNHKKLVILCGRFEGVDQRVLDDYGVEEVSLGDFILSGGELAALALIDACVRLLPGVMGHEEAQSEETFGDRGPYANLLEYPHYTRPAEWKGRTVPDVLVSGHHAEVERWRLQQAEALTHQRRKDLWDRYLAERKQETE